RCPDPVLLMAAGLACGAPLVLAPWPTLAVLLAAALTWWPRARRAVLATLVLAAAGAVAAGLSLDHAGGGYAATLRALPEPPERPVAGGARGGARGPGRRRRPDRRGGAGRRLSAGRRHPRPALRRSRRSRPRRRDRGRGAARPGAALPQSRAPRPTGARGAHR